MNAPEPESMRWWTLGALVAVWSVAVRVVVARSDEVAAFYYPDSWNYVVPNADGATPHSFHGPVLYWLWDLCIAGAVTEARVVVLQQVLGVAAVVLIALTLRRLVGDMLALGSGLVLGIQPLAMFFERSIMTEALATFLVAAVVFALGELLARPRMSVSVVVATTLGLAAGSLVALRPSSRGAAVVLVVAGLVVIVRGRATRDDTTKLLRAGIVAAVLVAASVLPLILMIENNRHYGTASLTPASGTALFSEYGWLVPCEPEAGDTTRTTASLLQVCDRERPELQPMWFTDGPLYQSFFANPEFAETQEQLWTRARGAVLRSPITVSGRAISTGVAHAFDPELQLRLYDNGYRWFDDASREMFVNHDRWFGGEQSRVEPLETPVFRVVRQTHCLPGIVFVAVAIMAVVACIRAALRVRGARRWRRAARRELEAFDRPLVMLAATALVAVAANEFVIAFGGIAIVRYWVPMLPVLVVAAAAVTELLVEAWSVNRSAAAALE